MTALYALKNTSCNKLAVGASFVPNGHFPTVYACNRNDDYSCKENDNCYKASVTGIYESSEETRKYCKSIHAEINLINKLKEMYPHKERNLLSDGTVYVTRYPCLECARNLILYGAKKVVYCGKQEISEEVKSLFSLVKDLEVVWDPELDYEFTNEDEYPWWTDKFYNEAYEIVKDRQAPFTIISYNNPTLTTLKQLSFDKMTKENGWKGIVFVRESQREMYEEATIQYPTVEVVSFPDELISNAGATRRATQKWMYIHGYNIAFQADDDVGNMGYLVKGKTADGREKSDYVSGINGNIGRVLAMWQIAMEKTISVNPKVVQSCASVQGLAFGLKECQKDMSLIFGTGSQVQVICMNVKTLVENDLFYADNKDCGLDDLDMTARCIKSGFQIARFSWLIYHCRPMGVNSQYVWSEELHRVIPGEQLRARFQDSQTKLKARHGDVPWIAFEEKRGLPQTSFRPMRIRKWQKEQGFYGDYDNYKFDIWKDGELLNEAKTGYSKEI
jgi:deoxycytidylate deaminase